MYLALPRVLMLYNISVMYMFIPEVVFVAFFLLLQMFLYEAAGILVVASPLPPEVSIHTVLHGVIVLYAYSRPYCMLHTSLFPIFHEDEVPHDN